MPRITFQDFNDQPIGDGPAGWAVSPSGSASIAVEPGGPGRCVAMTGQAPDQADCLWDVAPSVHGGTVGVSFRVRAGDAPVHGGITLEALGPEDQVLFGVTLKNDGHIRDASGNEFADPKTWAEEVWYTIAIQADLDARTYSVWIDLLLAGGDIPFPSSGSDFALLRFRLVAASGTFTAYLDDVDISAQFVSDVAPDRVTFVTSFALDAASVATRKNGVAPNRFSVSFDGANVLVDSLVQSWRSQDAGAGTHDLVFDFGEGGARSLRFVSLHGHNLSRVRANLAQIEFLGSQGGNWNHPDVGVNLSDQWNREPIVGWIPSGTACRYWCLRVTAASGGLLGVPYIEIGRVCGHTGYLTASEGMSVNYELSLTDPSLVTRMEGGAAQARVRSAYRLLDIQWRGLPVGDQEELEALIRASGVHAPWVVLLDPARRPNSRTLYAVLGDREVRFQRRHAERARLSLSFEEIVP